MNNNDIRVYNQLTNILDDLLSTNSKQSTRHKIPKFYKHPDPVGMCPFLPPPTLRTPMYMRLLFH